MKETLSLRETGMRFVREGGAWQLRLETLDDLRHSLELDDALWVANSATLSTLAIDPVLVRWLDSDGDGRLRVDGVRSAIRWLLEHLEMEPVARLGSAELCLAAVREDGSDGRYILEAGRKINRRFSGSDVELSAATVTLDQVRQTILAGFVGAVAAVMVPVTVVAAVKLAGRDLSCMLEGSGWGVNARMALTRGLARLFTERPQPSVAKAFAARRRLLWWSVAALLTVVVVGVSYLVRY